MGHCALVRLLKARDGTTAVEYAVLVALVLLACIGGINALGQSIARPMQDASQQIKVIGGGGVKVNKSRGTALSPKAKRQSSGRD